MQAQQQFERSLAAAAEEEENEGGEAAAMDGPMVAADDRCQPSSSSSSSSSYPRDRPAGPPPPLPPRVTLQVFVSVASLRFTLVNNSLGVPIAFAALLGADLRLHQDPMGLQAAAATSLRAGETKQDEEEQEAASRQAAWQHGSAWGA